MVKLVSGGSAINEATLSGLAMLQTVFNQCIFFRRFEFEAFFGVLNSNNDV